MKLEVTFPDKKIEPNETILFLDEIQSCPNARTVLKSFALDGTIDVISSGSLLGLYYKEVYSDVTLDDDLDADFEGIKKINVLDWLLE